jgi:thiol:disulfide interchange protein DsbC
MKLFKAALMAVCLAVPAMNSHADDASLRATLQERLPDAKIGQIRPSPVPGLVEVVVNGINVIYTDKKGDLAFVGNVVDLKTKESLTKKRSEELAFVDFSQIPLTQAIVKVKGDGSRKLVVFSDPDCPYCKQLEKELAFLDNVTIYVMLYPLEQLHPGARKKSESLWCSSDRAKAWDNLMLYGKEPAAATGECKTPLDEIHALAQRLSITGTPGLVFQNGKLVPGALKTEQIEELLKAASKS